MRGADRRGGAAAKAVAADVEVVAAAVVTVPSPCARARVAGLHGVSWRRSLPARLARARSLSLSLRL
eukprot:scaffold3586_cov404-Prasinococcus_capsulatus_cf.AAC.1